MSSGKLKSRNEIKIDHFYDLDSEFQSKVSKVVIPFTKSDNTDYIYDGSEQIPFKERDPIYRLILIEEFVNVI